MKRIYFLLLALLPLFASAQITPAQDTTLFTGSTPFTPQFRFKNITLSGGNYRIPQVYNSILGKYDTYVTTKYLRAFYSGGGATDSAVYTTLNRYRYGRDTLFNKAFHDTVSVYNGFSGNAIKIKFDEFSNDGGIFYNDFKAISLGSTTRINSPGSGLTIGIAGNPSGFTLNSSLGFINTFPTRFTNVSLGTTSDRVAMLDPSTGLFKYLPFSALIQNQTSAPQTGGWWTNGLNYISDPIGGKRLVLGAGGFQAQGVSPYIGNPDTLTLNPNGGIVNFGNKDALTYNYNTNSLIVGKDARSGLFGLSTGDFIARGSAGSGGIPKFRTQGIGVGGYMAFDRWNGTSTAPTALNNGDMAGSVVMVGQYGTGIGFAGLHAAEMRYYANQNWSSSQMGSRIDWYNIHNGATTQTLDMRLSNDSLIVYGKINSKEHTITGANTNSLNIKQTSGSTTSFHAGQFGDQTYLSNNWYYNGSQSYDDNTKQSTSIVLNPTGIIDFNTAVANTVPTTKMSVSATGVAVTGGVNISGLSPSLLVLTDASKNLVSGSTLPSGITATTQTAGISNTTVATTEYADKAGRIVVASAATSITIPSVFSPGVEYNLILTGASLQTVTLPLAISQGSRISITGVGAGGWKIAQTLDVIKTTGGTTTTGAAGYVQSTAQYNSIILENTQATGAGAGVYVVQSIQGSPTFN